jgi:hypothetical protein
MKFLSIFLAIKIEESEKWEKKVTRKKERRKNQRRVSRAMKELYERDRDSKKYKDDVSQLSQWRERERERKRERKR